MKTKSHVHWAPGGWRKLLPLAMAVVLPASAPGARAASAAELLEQGIYTEETRGEVRAAIEVYQRIVEDPRADRGVVAQAQLRLGLCQLKMGNRPQAISALERLTQEFPDRDKLMAIVEQQMPQLLDEIVQQIERNYIQEVDRAELMETAIRAIVGKLDSRGGYLGTNELEFLGAREMKQFNEQLDQKIAGVGAVLKVEEGEVVVQTPLPGSPALTGGLRAGDRLVTIDGAALPARGLETAVRLLRGPTGTAVTVGVKRAGSEDLHEIRLVRDTIRLPSVSGHRRKADNTWDFMLDEQGGIGYVRLSAIGRESAAEMQAALEDLGARGLKALVLDLRNAPGGLLDGAVAIADLFVESGRIVTVKGRGGDTVYDAKPAGTMAGFPMALIVNRKTASASEIIAACLQDHRRAVVIGERTFGEGIVRSLFQLKSGVGAVKLPIAAYYRPSGKSMHRYPDSKDSDDWGVIPDPGCEIVLSDEEEDQHAKDRVARGALDGGAAVNQAPPDRQLEKALERLRSGTGTR